jgi:hypothetical protein
MKPLQHIPLEFGNKVAWWLLILALGFAAGWIANGLRWSSICFPIL